MPRGGIDGVDADQVCIVGLGQPRGVVAEVGVAVFRPFFDNEGDVLQGVDHVDSRSLRTGRSSGRVYRRFMVRPAYVIPAAQMST